MYKDIYVKLDSSYQSGNSMEIQKKARQMLLELYKGLNDDEICNEIEDLLSYVKGNNFAWPNIIEILSIIGYPRIKKAIPSLIGFLEDTNWIGANEAQKLLGSLDPKVYINELNSTLSRALKSNDEGWVYFISAFVNEYLLEELIEPQFKKEMNELVEKYLDYHYRS